MTMPASPEATSSRTCSLLLRRHRPRQQRHPRRLRSAPPSSPAIASGPSTSRIDRACWAARTSVGASSAHWYPASTICSIASTETMVLPGPDLALQHPVHRPARRQLGGEHARAPRCWPSVSSNGNRLRIAATRPSSRCGRRGAGLAQLAVAPRTTNAHCSPTASSISQPLRSRASRSAAVLRDVDGTQRLVLGDQIVFAQKAIPAGSPRSDPARRAPDAHTRRCPSSAPSLLAG